MGRVIFLVDMNAFYISCEMSRNPELKGRPAAVAGDPENRRGIILAANYDARKYAVKTTMTVNEARKLCPGIVLVPPDHDFYELKSREVMKLLSEFTPVIQQNSIDEAWLDVTGCGALFGEPVEMAEKIMNRILNELDLWCSIGISENKFLAKMASEMKKPLGITEVWLKDVPQKIWPLPVGKMYGIGQQTEKKLSELAIFTIGDLARADIKVLRKNFGRYGEEIHRLANGLDFSEVTEFPQHDSKSISRSTTLKNDITDLDFARTILLRLAEEVGEEARRQGCKGKTVSIVIKYSDFQSITRQKSIMPTYLTKDIYNTGAALLEENWNPHRPVRLLGIALANITDENARQLSIFDLPGEGANYRTERLERAMDEIRLRFGKGKITRAKTLELNKKELRKK